MTNKTIVLSILVAFGLLITLASNLPTYNEICEFQYGEDYEFLCDNRFDICFCGIDLGNNTIIEEKEIMSDKRIQNLSEKCDITYLKFWRSFEDCLEDKDVFVSGDDDE